MSELKIDDFLSEQSRDIFQATIEPVEGQPKKCKLTPWVEHAGCQCSSALIIEKSQIKSVTKTEHRHFCCGKSLIVVEVNFADKASIPLSDVFAQASQAATSGHHEHGHHHDTASQGTLGYPGTAYQVPQAAFGGMYPAIGEAAGYPPIVSYSPCPCHQPGYQCMACGGQLSCNPIGSSCCMSGVCGPGYHCAICGTVHRCIPNGTHC